MREPDVVRGRRVGVYDPYLDAMGGGEKVVLTLLEALIEQGHETFLLSPRQHAIDAWQHLGIDLCAERFTWRQADDESLVRVTGDLDILCVLHNRIPPLHGAGAGLAIVQFPRDILPFRRKRDFLHPWTAWRRRRACSAALGAYERLVCYSEFVRTAIKSRLGRDAVVVPPPVDVGPLPTEHRESRILTVGRFFRGDHNKKHDVMIEAFRQLLGRIGPERGCSLALAGGVRDHAPAREYVESLREQAQGLPITFHVNVHRDALEQLYATSQVFWHATGFGEDVTVAPERMEHFGISTVEAMVHGCVAVVIRKGGQTEIVDDGVTGVLWDSLDELV